MNGSDYYSSYEGLDVVGDYIYTGSIGEVEVHFNRTQEHVQTHGNPARNKPAIHGTVSRTEEWLENTLTDLQDYFVPSLIATGFVGNSFAIFVMLRTRLCKFSYINYLIALLISDCCYLFNLLCLWMAERGINIYKLGAWCHFVIFLSQSSSFLSLWYITCFLLDRFIALNMQHWARSLCTTVKAKIAVIGLALVAIAVFLNISLTVGVIIIPGPQIFCVPLRRFQHSWTILGRMDIFINCIFPYLLASLMTGFGLWAAKKEGILCSRNRRTVIGPHRTPQPIEIYDSDLEKGQTCLFFSYALMHLALSLPSQFLRIHQTFGLWVNPAGHMTKVGAMWQKLLSHLYHTRTAINIFLLLICYKGFRLAIKYLLLQMHKAIRRRCQHRDHENPVVTKEQERWQLTGGNRLDHSEDSEAIEMTATDVRIICEIDSQ